MRHEQPDRPRQRFLDAFAEQDWLTATDVVQRLDDQGYWDEAYQAAPLAAKVAHVEAVVAARVDRDGWPLVHTLRHRGPEPLYKREDQFTREDYRALILDQVRQSARSARHVPGQDVTGGVHRACPVCGSQQWWISRTRRRICRQCHPTIEQAMGALMQGDRDHGTHRDS